MASPERDKGLLQSTGKDKKRQKKRKAEHTPPLHIPPGNSSTSTPETPPRPKSSNLDYPNTVPVIFRHADSKFKTVKQVMSELSPTRRHNLAKRKQNEGMPRPKLKDQSTQSLPN